MNVKYTIALLALLITPSLQAQNSVEASALEKINKDLPHKFKVLKTGATLELEREPKVVKIFMLIDDIEQYTEILVERGDELQKNYSQCKVVEVEKGKYKNNYIELIDQYPLSSKMSNVYRIKTVTSEGIIRMFPPVTVPVMIEHIVKK